MSTFARLGGETGVRRFADDLSTRLTRDPQLGPLFEGIDPSVLREHREFYFAAVLGGPEHYSGRSMREAHGPLGVTDAQLDRFLVLVDESLTAVDADVTAAIEVRELLERLRPIIVSPTPGE